MGNKSNFNQKDYKKSKSEERDWKRSENPNLQFHLGKLDYVRSDIRHHIKEWENYKDMSEFYHDLESDHSFIQWIFPNFFKSMFNYDSYRLTVEERNLMIKDDQVMQQFKKNYKMFLRFLGIELKDELKLIDKKQFKLCIFINTHNQMRLQRVLASLSVLNQRHEALNLLKFLKNEIPKVEGQRFSKSLYDRTYKNYEQLQEEIDENNIIEEKIHQNVIIEEENKIKENQDSQESKEDKEPQVSQLKEKQTDEQIQEEVLVLKNLPEENIIKNQEQSKPSWSIKSSQPLQSIQGDQHDHTITDYLSDNSMQDQQLQQQIKGNEIQSEDDSNSKNKKQKEQFSPSQIHQNNNPTWETQKSYYVQRDILDEAWVTVKLLTKQQI